MVLYHKEFHPRCLIFGHHLFGKERNERANTQRIDSKTDRKRATGRGKTKKVWSKREKAYQEFTILRGRDETLRVGTPVKRVDFAEVTLEDTTRLELKGSSWKKERRKKKRKKKKKKRKEGKTKKN
jgi:hypothetical protein